MDSKDLDLVKIGQNGEFGRYVIVPAVEIGGGDVKASTVNEQYGSDTATVFDEDTVFDVNFKPLEIKGKSYNYIPYGDDDDMPGKIRRLIGDNMVTAQGMAFDILACYGQGLRFVNRDDISKTADDEEIRKFCLRNSIHECYMEQATDMKYYYFTVTEIILSGDMNKIVKIRHLESCYCRFEQARNGRIEHVFYGDFGRNTLLTKVVAIPLLDLYDPLGDLLVRLGREPDPKTGKMLKTTNEHKFAIACRMPTPGFRYYPLPYYLSIFRDHWYDIYKLIGLGKKYLIKNTSAPRVQIEVHDEYWQRVCQAENIIDPEKQVERIKEERKKIIDFVCGPENAGKAILTHYYIDPNGKECRMVRIYDLTEGRKQGGDWSDDMSEASNALCFALGVHPNLIGATPGKSQMNNSGSDKRELFTLKQAMEKAFHDVMAKPWNVILYFNGWADKYTVDVPMIELTTLDKNTGSQEVTLNNNGNGNESDNNTK